MGSDWSIFEKNYALFMERFPKMALELPKGSDFGINLVNVKALYIYGVGQGETYFQVRDWLKGDGERRLIFFEDDPKSMASFLHLVEAKEILEDSQVIFAGLDEMDRIVEQFPYSHVEVVALPHKNTEWKEELLQKAAFAYALHNERLHGYQPLQNLCRNLRHLPTSFYANGLKGKFQGVPAIVCGAGPSLQKAIPFLKTMENRALLIAGGSTLAALSKEGIAPHFAMALDPNLEEYRRLKNSFAFEVPFLYSTRLFPAVFQTANGPFGYMRSGIGGAVEIWLEERLGLFDPLIGEKLSAGAISVTSICLAWAEFLGCNPIILSGVDLAYTDNVRYAPGVADENCDPNEVLGSVDRLVQAKDRHGKPIVTAVRWLMESEAFSDFAHMHSNTQFMNTTDGGIGFKKIPYCPFEEVAGSLHDVPFSLRERIQQEIGANPMPQCAQETIEKNMGQLRESLERVVSHLKVCAKVEAGSLALAEFELREELAFSLLFYDAEGVIEKELSDPMQKWEKFLHLAKQYQYVLTFMDH